MAVWGSEEKYVCGLELTGGISVLAAAIAQNLEDEELTLLAAIFTQLGDTLGTIAAQRDFCKKINEKNLSR